MPNLTGKFKKVKDLIITYSKKHKSECDGLPFPPNPFTYPVNPESMSNYNIDVPLHFVLP